MLAEKVSLSFPVYNLIAYQKSFYNFTETNLVIYYFYFIMELSIKKGIFKNCELP